MEFALFPGCVLKGAAAEAEQSLYKVCEALGIGLTEIPNWTCCGASHAQGVNDLAALAVNARNISIAEHMGLDIMTVCNTCTLQLRTAKYRLDHDEALKEKVNALLREAGHPYPYQGTSKITHFLWVLDEHPELLAGKVTDALHGIRVASYYGCHILRADMGHAMERQQVVFAYREKFNIAYQHHFVSIDFPQEIMDHGDGKHPAYFERLCGASARSPSGLTPTASAAASMPSWRRSMMCSCARARLCRVQIRPVPMSS